MLPGNVKHVGYPNEEQYFLFKRIIPTIIFVLNILFQDKSLVNNVNDNKLFVIATKVPIEISNLELNIEKKKHGSF